MVVDRIMKKGKIVFSIKIWFDMEYILLIQHKNVYTLIF